MKWLNLKWAWPLLDIRYFSCNCVYKNNKHLLVLLTWPRFYTQGVLYSIVYTVSSYIVQSVSMHVHCMMTLYNYTVLLNSVYNHVVDTIIICSYTGLCTQYLHVCQCTSYIATSYIAMYTLSLHCKGVQYTSYSWQQIYTMMIIRHFLFYKMMM